MGASSNPSSWYVTSWVSSWDKGYCKIQPPTFTNGRMKVQHPNGKWGYIDSTGKVLGQIKWYSVGDFKDGMAIVQGTDNLYGFINEKGEQVGEVCWKQVNVFSHGLAAVQDAKGYWGFINKQNQVEIPCQYTEVMAFRADGTCDVKTAQGTWIVIDTKGEVSFFGH